MKQIGTTPAFSYDEHIRGLKEKFSRLIRNAGFKNTKGTKRYELEVNFAYMMHELEMGPLYLRGKLFEQANDVSNTLVAYVKANSKVEEEASA